MKKTSIKNKLLELCLASDLNEAEKLLISRRVRVNGLIVSNASQLIAQDAEVSLVSDPKYFSRAGEKLDYALQRFNLKLENKICADVGASTGGFSGVLLSEKAVKVYAIDVARGEIAWKLRTDPRIVLMEKTNARHLESLPEAVDFVCIDVSFISVSLILPNVKKWLKPYAYVVVLVKPQFEADKEMVPGGGVIIDPEVHKSVLEKFYSDCQQTGFVINNACSSPIHGTHGNKEFLALLSLGGVNKSQQEFVEAAFRDKSGADLNSV